MGATKFVSENELTIAMPLIVEKNIFEDPALPVIEKNKNITLDFTATKAIERSFYPFLHQFKMKLERDGLKLHSSHINTKLKTQISTDGVLRMFNCLEVNQSRQPKKGLDVGFITPFVKATKEILKVQANIDSDNGKPRAKEKNENMNFDIIGVISLVSKAFEGSITLCFKEDVFLKICSSMLGEEYKEINADIEDAAGELLNIIFGVAKAELNDQQDYKIEKALPTVIAGKGVRVRQSVGPTIILPFTSTAGDFQIEIEAVQR